MSLIKNFSRVLLLNISFEVSSYLSRTIQCLQLLFSAHISYGKGKYLNQTGFFYKICQAPNLYLTLKVLPIEFNSHKFRSVRYVFVEISGLFLVDPKDPRMTPKIAKISIFLRFNVVFVNFSIDAVD